MALTSLQNIAGIKPGMLTYPGDMWNGTAAGNTAYSMSSPETWTSYIHQHNLKHRPHTYTYIT